MLRNSIGAIAMLGSAAVADDRAQLPDMSVAVLSDRQACRAVVIGAQGDSVIRLGMAGYCTLHRDPVTGALRMMDGPLGPVFLVESSTPEPDGSGDCRTQVQAVMLTKDGPIAAPAPALVASCLPYIWDDVMFLGVF